MAESEKHGSISLHAHGDGTFHTFSPARGGDGISYGGEREQGRVEHKSIGAALMHIAKNHAPNDHVHVEGHEDGFTSHSVREGARVQGPHDHKNLRELKRSMSQFFDEEGEED